LLVLLPFISASEDDVLVLTKDNFDQTVNSADLILVEFYAPWCGHCKNLAPKYAEAAGILKKENPPILLAKVDCTVENDLATRFSISGYPTLKVFRNGEPSDYKGPRETQGIVKSMQKQAIPAYQLIEKAEDLEQKVKKNPDITIVGFFGNKEAPLAKAFVQASSSLREQFSFAVTYEKNVFDKFGYQQAVVLFKTLDDKAVFTGSENKDSLVDWIYGKSLSVAGEYTSDNADRYLRSGFPILKIFFDVDYKSNLKRTNYYLNRLKKLASNPKFEGKLLFTIAAKRDFQPDWEKFGFGTAEFGIGIDDHSKALRYKFDKEFNVQNLEAFATDFLDGKLKPHIKSEPLPDNEGKAVKVVVGQNFNDIVLDPTKDVLLEMYAPWCGHCKKLEPIYTELGESVKNVDNLVIAKMDATANDSPHPQYQAKGFPTILFAPADNKENPIKYSGEREVKAFKDFLKQKANAGVWSKKEDL
jgi:protein disulfide isomerase family A protein 3